jgi:hypothetical protein
MMGLNPCKGYLSDPDIGLKVVAKSAGSENPDFTSIDALLYGSL